MTGQLGVVYLLHFSRPYRHARHYTGWTEDLLDRLDEHASGQGARLMAVIKEAGIGFILIRVTERAIKNEGGAVRYCPLCSPRPRTGPWGPLPADLTPRYYPCPAPPGPRYILLTDLAGRRSQP
jgi:predicted GIY-YIG superfamily endonuclease